MLIRAALEQARAVGVARLDAQWLLGHLLSRPREWLLAHDDQTMADAQAGAWQTLLARRATGEPLAYLVGEREFCGLRLKVSPAVLIPRPETELLVRWALELLPSAPEATVVDLGTGSGAIALAVKHARTDVAVCASDASGDALAVARDNAAALGVDVEFTHGDWWTPLQGRRFGLALSNPPYVAGGDPHLRALSHEPQAALTPGGDGLAALRQIIEGAPNHLLPGAWLLLEHGHDQGKVVRELLLGRGFATAQTRPDLAQQPRCTGATWPSAN